MEKVNKDRATALFEQYAILFGNSDGVPEQTAAEILGKDAVDFAYRLDSGRGFLWGGYGNGSHTAMYLTLRGFLTACTYNNVSALEREEKAGAVAC